MAASCSWCQDIGFALSDEGNIEKCDTCNVLATDGLAERMLVKFLHAIADARLGGEQVIIVLGVELLIKRTKPVIQ